MQAKFIVELLDNTFSLTCLDKNDCYPIIIKLLSSNEVYTITQEEHEKVSILAYLDISQKQYIESKGSCCLDYHCLTIDTAQPALDSSGMLNTITTLFATHKISILCTSTFNRNFIYFRVDDKDDVIKMLKESPDYEFFKEEKSVFGW